MSDNARASGNSARTLGDDVHPREGAHPERRAPARHAAGALTVLLLAMTGWLWTSGGAGRGQVRPPAPASARVPGFPPVMMPLEVMGARGTVVAASVLVPQTSAPVTTLWMQVHGLSYAGKASVQVNGGPWIALGNDTAAVEEPGKSYGGIGGGFATLKLSVPLPAGAVAPGQNQVAFRFNGTDGVSIGFRVLKFQMRTAQGQGVLPPSAFADDDPARWKPPLPAAADVQAGSDLWHSATLRESSLVGAPNILATCSDCHAQDGRDLKYFNYSNTSIIERSKFHGLTGTQGKQIASYVRSLRNADGSAIPAPGRPWNPPYQPGPGIDAKPVSSWAAGAGVDAVLTKDTDMVPYLFPNGIGKDAVASSETLNMRELPIALQLIDWNHWLPRTHPKDAWGPAFARSGLNAEYPAIRGYLSGTSGTAPTAGGIKAQLNYFQAQTLWFDQGRVFPNLSAGDYTQAKFGPDANLALYSAAQWHAVKEWELMQEFGLEGRGSAFFGAKAEGERQWLTGTSFYSSPAMMRVPAAGEAGTPWSDTVTFAYLNTSWYQLQLIQNAGNRQRAGNNPVDWGYLPGRTIASLYAPAPRVDVVRLTAQLVKGMQEQDNGIGPQGNYGFAPNNMSNVALLGLPFFRGGGDNTDYNAGGWKAAPAGTRAEVLTAYLGAYSDLLGKFTPQQYYQDDGYGGIARPDEDPSAYSNRLGYKLYTAIPRYRAIGVDGALLNSLCDWAGTVWPKGNWAALKQ